MIRKMPLFHSDERKPPIINGRNALSNTYSSASYSISEPTTTIHGGLERHIKYGSLINLTCEIQSYPGPLQYVVWYRNHQSLMKNPRYDVR